MGIFQMFNAFLNRYDRDYRYHQFLEASLAAAALLALADGEISFAELMARDYITERLAEIQSFDIPEAVEIFRTYAERLENQFEKTKKQILTLAQGLSEDKELALLLIRTGIVLVKADQKISASEWKVLEELGKAVGVTLSEIEELVKNPF